MPARRALRGRAEQLPVRVRGHRLRGRGVRAQHRRVRAAAVPQRGHLRRPGQRLPLRLLPRLHRYTMFYITTYTKTF